MGSSRTASSWRVSALALLSAAAAAAAGVDYDVVVYGSTPAGCAAASAAAELGARVALYEPLPMIGGMGAAGNLALHDGDTRTALGHGSGLALNFSMLNAEHYGVTHPVGQPESFVANASWWKLLQNAGVRKIELGCRLTGATAAAAGGGVASITVQCEPEPVTATVFIDASYDGDIMVSVGTVEHTSGREAASTYNESLAGARVPTAAGVAVSALREDGTLLKYVQNLTELAAPGEADDALMAFQHRYCISGDADRLPWKAPEGYDREDFLLFERYINASGGGGFNGFGWPGQRLSDHGYPGPKDKYTLCCGITIAASDQPNLNKGWASASWERKQQIIADHTYFELGMLYFLSHDDAVPQAVRDRFNSYGLCADEFEQFGHVPPQLYIRESNRLVGDYVMTQNNLAKPAWRADSIAVAHWWLDKHMTGKYAVPVPAGDSGSGSGSGSDGEQRAEMLVQLEGNFPHNSETVPPPYDVPFSLMVPKRGTGANLLVPVCLSVSSAAFASTRIETMLMSVGSAAGVAAMQLVSGQAAAVHDVNVTAVQEVLVSAFQQEIHVATPVPTPPPTPPLPTAKYYDVTGAGSAAWNGRYTLVAGAPNPTGAAAPAAPAAPVAAVYTMASKDCPNGEACALYGYQGVWRLASQGKEVFYTADAPGTATGGSQPPLAGWREADGAAPAPTLAAGPPVAA